MSLVAFAVIWLATAVPLIALAGWAGCLVCRERYYQEGLRDGREGVARARAQAGGSGG